MKHLFFTIAGVIMLAQCVSAQTQSQEVPQDVLSSFETNVGVIEGVRWEVEEGTYEAEYLVEGREHSVLFDLAGKVLTRKSQIAMEDLPEQIMSFINSRYDIATVEEANEIDTPAGIFYEVEIETDKKELGLLFSATGNILAEKSSQDSDEDEDENR